MTLSAMVARPTGRNWVRADRFGGRCKAFLCRGGTHQGMIQRPALFTDRRCGSRDKSRGGILGAKALISLPAVVPTRTDRKAGVGHGNSGARHGIGWPAS